tara:strand:- start:249 stop:422 length:174 start_codon:yes stop_codon:yes gene_type:complete
MNINKKIMSVGARQKIQLPIGEEDIRLFEELILGNIKPFNWTFEGVDIEFIKDEGEE